MYDFRRTTLFCSEKRLSNHKITYFLKIWEGMAPLALPWLRLWCGIGLPDVFCKNTGLFVNEQ